MNHSLTKMYNKKKISEGVILALSTVIASGLCAPVMAQEQEDEAAVLEEMFVTGSRIRQNANLISASPVVSVGAEEFQYTGITRVEDLLNDLPQVTGSNVANDSNGSTGTASVDLRDLGTQRTLTLMNGRRLPVGSPIAGGAGADLNFIPSLLVKRVEVLTGGSSATYGSDAIAGVVNFITVDDFEGFRVDLQGSAYQHKNDNGRLQDLVNESGFDLPDENVFDGESATLSLIWGKNFSDGRGNITGYLNYRETNAVTQSERDYSVCALDGYFDDDSIACGGSSTLPEGRFTDFGIFAGDEDEGIPSQSFDYIVSGDQFVERDGLLYNFAPTNYFQRPDERITAGFTGHFDFSDTLTAYVEVGYMNNKTLAQIAPSGAFFVTDSLNCGNPLLSDQQFQLLCGDFDLTEDDSQSVFIGRRNVEGGNRISDLEHEQSRIVLGLKGELDSNWSFDAFFNYGEVDLTQKTLNDLSITNIERALNVVADPVSGEAVCQSVLDGTDPNCVPWNIFTEGAVTSDQTDYLVLDLNATGSTKITNFSGFVSGDLTDSGVIFPAASVGVQLVVGYEYRKEELIYEPNEGFLSGDGAGQGGPTLGVDGSLTSHEVFLEAEVPLSDAVSAGFGYRYSDYDTGKNTDTYKVTLGWDIVSTFKVRASFQAATRHANIRELFAPASLGLFNGQDDCAGTDPIASLEACENTGVTADRYGTIAESPAAQYNSITGGDVNLEPEDSDTYSVGFVWTPDAIEGFDLTVDWFNIDVTDAIDSIGAQLILDSCLSSGEFCDLISRDEGTQALWLGDGAVTNLNSNIGFQEREGIDISANYDFSVGNAGGMTLAYTAGYVLTNDRQALEGADVVDCNGKWNGSCFQPNPKYRHNMRLSWHTQYNITPSLAWRHHGAVDDTLEGDDGVTSDFAAQDYIDLSAVWSPSEQLSFRAGVNNLFDREPPLSADGSNGNVEVTEYDVLGRYLFFGVTYNL